MHNGMESTLSMLHALVCSSALLSLWICIHSVNSYHKFIHVDDELGLTFNSGSDMYNTSCINSG